MKQVLIIALVIGCLSFELPADLERQVLTAEEIAEINSMQNLWVASENQFTKISLREAISMHRAPEAPVKQRRTVKQEKVSAVLPVKFDASIFWPSCVVPVGNQGGACAASYAFATAASLSERLCISDPTTYTGMNFSAQYLAMCSTLTLKCSGGSIADAWQELISTGTAVASCQPWVGLATCSNVCANGTPVTLYKANQGSIVELESAEDMQQAIYTSGAITSGMTVYQDFLSYKSGIYTHVTGGPVGAIIVKVFGWGTDGTNNYWICSNSLGTSWGMQGIFWIQFGQCGIDMLGTYGSISLN